MSGSALDTFHLAYVPVAGSIADVVASSNKNSIDNGNNGADLRIAIRRASSLRLYRCRSHHRNESSIRRGNSTTEISSEKPFANNCSEQQRSDEECHCCCCRAENCSSDSLLSIHKTVGANSLESNAVDVNIFRADQYLAVMVPSSLTRSLVNLVAENNATFDERLQNGITNNSLEEHNMQQLLVDAEIELRKSIHPCLCPNEYEPLHAIHSNGDKSHDGINMQQQQIIEERPAHPLIPPQLFVCVIITSNNVSNCTNFPADVVLLAPKSNHLKISFSAHNNRNHLLDRDRLISHYSNLLNHETASNAPWSVIKAFPVSTILPMTCGSTGETTKMNTNTNLAFDIAALPCCPVCLNLIEPTRLGLPELKPQHKCSRWCTSSNDFHGQNDFSKEHSCVNEMKFLPWPPPAECAACRQRQLSMDSNASGGLQQRSSLESPLLSSPVAQRTALQMDDQEQTNHNTSTLSNESFTAQSSHSHTLTCHQCAMSSTLWVCLTCGVVGCGRYTLRHAAEHYASTGHPYSLELATGRIWDYENGKFVHRRDLVECPVLAHQWGIATAGGEGVSSPSTLVASSLSSNGFLRADSNFSENSSDAEWMRQGSGEGLNRNSHDGLAESASCRNNNCASPPRSKLSEQPKKSIMIGHEYEALLQSALEDQAQHYEGEISRLRADLASSLMHETQISDRESREIHALKTDSDRLKQDIDRLSSDLLEAQTKESKHRSMSQRLLREQSIAKELLEKIRKETMKAHESGKRMADDLEMQIADLTANIRMMQQFAENEELSQAQICCTIGGEKEGGKQRGKKSRRGRKKG